MPQIIIKTDMRTSNGVDFQACESPATKSWRLVHDGKKIIDYFESEGITATINTLFVDTSKSCNDEIAKLGLSAQVGI